MYANTPILPGPTYTGRPVNVYRVADAVLAALAAGECGATIGTHGTPYAGDGILVALPEYSATITLDPGDLVLPIRVDAWVERVAHAVTVAGSPRRYFGAWVDGTTLHLDVVEAFSSAEEREAIFAGIQRGQRAIFHAGRRECIMLTSDAMLAA